MSASEMCEAAEVSSQESSEEVAPRIIDDDGLDECRPSLDLPSLAGGSKGTGPRLFAGHVPKEVNDEMVRQHFSQWGTVSDVYFPRHKRTLKRRPFCFITFANREDAERALSQSGLEIGGVPIKNLTMVEDRDKYYTNKHASARQALLQALKQLGPSSTAPNVASIAALPVATPTSAVTSEQLSNLAAIMALEGVHSDVVLQTLGLPPNAAAAIPTSAPPMPALTASTLASLDSATLNSQLLQALASPSLSSQTAFDMRGSFDLSAAMRSNGNSMDLSSLQHSLAAAAAGLPIDAGSVGARMHTADSRSTLASADWSRGPSARTSMDTNMLLPAAAAGMGSMQARLSLDAALQLQQAQQQQAAHQAMLASQTHSRMSSSAYPLPPMAPQANMTSVMHSDFYQAQAQAQAVPLPQQQQPELQHSLQSVLSSGLYGGGGPPSLPPTTRHSMHEFSGNGMPFADATWAPHSAQQHQQLGGYSTVLRPSIDRAGLPPLPPRSPNQDPLGRQGNSGSPDTLMGVPGSGWPIMSGRVTA